MQELDIRFQSEDGTSLAGRETRESTTDAAILCHPHPLYGGNMDNNVVLAARGALWSRGIDTLRFNFRGVGGSEGSFDDGVAEKGDIRGAINHLKTDRNLERIHAAVYSFGSRVFLDANRDETDIQKVALIAPPVSFMDFSPLPLPSPPTLIVVGEYDEYCAKADLERWLDAQPIKADLVILPEVNHFFGGAESALGDLLRDFFSTDR